MAADGRAGRVSWASYAPGESYLVVTVGLLSRTHHVLPAGAVMSVGDGEVHVGLSRREIGLLPLLPHPQAPTGDGGLDPVTAFENAALKWPQKW